MTADEVLAVVRSATVKYRRPGSGRMTAVGTISADAADEFLAKFQDKGRAFVTVSVRVSGAEGDVLTAEFHWFVTAEQR